MNKKSIIIGTTGGIFMILLLCLIMCDNNPNPEENTLNKDTEVTEESLEKNFASGTALICNEKYYQIYFNDVMSFYFSGIDENGDFVGFQKNEEDVEPIVTTGTGFLVSEDGLIATNNHVVAATVDPSQARSLLVNAIANETDEFKKKINEINEQIATLQKEYKDDNNQRTKKKIDKLREDRDELQDIINLANRLNAAEYTVYVKSNNYAVFHDTYITNENDLRGCQLIDTDPNHDLAILQLSDKKVPDGRHIFKLDKTGKIAPDETLYMIGFNEGPTLANTQKGITAQITEGKMAQDRGNEFMHTIPSAQGSSGSPILNKKGEVVGVNYALLENANDFKFGIKSLFLDELIQKIKKN